MRITTLLLAGFLFFAFLDGDAWARKSFLKDSALPSERSATYAWKESVSALKESTERLLKENELFNKENNLLRQEILKIKEKVEETRKKNKRLLGEPARLKKLIKKREAENKLIHKEINFLDGQLRILKNKIASSQKELSKIKKKQKPWEEQVAELNSQKIDLSLDLQQEESLKYKELEATKSEINWIKEQLLTNEKELTEKHEEIDEGSGTYTKLLTDIKRLQKENKGLSSQLAQIQKTLHASDRERKILEDENVNIQQSIQDQMAKQDTQKAEWQDKVGKLRIQLEEIRKTKDISPETLSKEEQALFDEINALEIENQEREGKVNDLGEAIALLERENAMIEDLLSTQKQPREIRAVKEGLPQETMPGIENVSEAMAYALASQGLYEEAIEKYKQALKEGGNKRNIYFNMGYVYYRMGNLRYAIHYYKKVLGIDPTDEEAKYNIMTLREELKGSRR